jgi:4-hydroxy-tetrahydrodipicolinate synthase
LSLELNTFYILDFDYKTDMLVHVVQGDRIKMKLRLYGVYAALVTPIDEFGRPDLAAFDRVIEFIVEREVDGVVIGGGTAEYPHFDVNDRAALAAQAVRRIAGRRPVAVCVGTSSVHTTLTLTRSAAESGCDALVLPMPSFFQYSQDDLVAYCETVCASVPMPFLLYNLPSFTNNAVEVPTAIRLLNEVPNLIGMKDSSGNVADLKPLGEARKRSDFSLFVGDDSVLLGALQAGWDGVVSGIACFVPELIGAVYRSYRSGDEALASSYQAMLDALIEQVVRLPIPWGVRVGLEARGIANGPLHLPPSPQRLRQINELRSWLRNWAEARSLPLDEVWKSIPAERVGAA